MRDAVFFEGPEASRKVSRFWILLALASVIASAGVVADSTATVIGARIVAPHMIPILGTMLGVVLFGTNVAAILATGFIVMAIYRVHRLVAPASTPERRAVNRRSAGLVIVAFVFLIGVPLTSATIRIGRDTADEARIRRAAEALRDHD